MPALEGRLGLETARVPHADRHGCLWLGRGNLVVEDGSLVFLAAEGSRLQRGAYSIPFQAVSSLILEPGTTVSHDALRLTARHGTGVIFVGEGGVRFYASLPAGQDESALARAQVMAWADPDRRVSIARRMYAWRLGEVLPSTDITVLRGIEGARVKTLYRGLAQQYGLNWAGRRYDRDDPLAADLVNQAINHSSTAVRASALVAVAATSTIPQLGFIHEDSAAAFALDIADLFRESVCLPAGFRAVREYERQPGQELERLARRSIAAMLREKGTIPAMIDRIKQLFSKDAPE